MASKWIEIEQLAINAHKGVSTVRKHLKDLPKDKKDLYIKKIQLEGKGGIKHLYHIDLITLLFLNERDDRDAIETGKNEAKYQEQKEPEQRQNDNSIIELLNNENKYLKGEIEFKNAQFLSVSNENKELIERIREMNVLLLNTQKQLTSPQDKIPMPHWWQFWK